MPETGGQERNPRAGRIYTALALIVAVAHFVFIMKYFEPAISTMDSHGYHNQAKLLAATGKTYLEPDNDYQYVGFTWRELRDGKYYTFWPPGYPLLLASVYKTAGPETSLYVNPVMASLAILALFLVVRFWLGPAWALFATVLCVALPHFNQQSLFGYPHVATLLLLLLGLYCVERWIRTEKLIWPLAAGLLLGAIPSMRFMEGLFIPAVGMYALFQRGLSKDRLREYIAFCIGAAVCIIPLLVYNHATFGSAMKTGYSIVITQMEKTIRLEFFLRNYLLYLQMLLAEGGGIVFGAGALGIIAMCTMREWWTRGVLMLSLVLPTMLLYFAYFTYPVPQTVRFFVPLLPFFAVGTAWLLKTLADGNRITASALVAFTLLFTFAWGIPQSVEKMEYLHRRHRMLVNVKNVLDTNAPRGSVVIGEEAVCHYLDYIGRWKIAITTNRNRSGRSAKDDMKRRNPLKNFAGEISRWSDGGRIFVIVDDRDLPLYMRSLGPLGELRIVDKVKIPRAPIDRHAIPEQDMNQEARKMAGRNKYNSSFDPRKAGQMDAVFDALMSGKEIFVCEWMLNRKMIAND